MMNTEKHEKSMNVKSLLPAILACLAWQTVAPVMAVPRPRDEPTAEASRTGDVIILPIVFYSPETKIAGGLGGLLTFRPSRAGAAERPSSIYFYTIYTQLKQFSMSWEPEFYSRQETWLVKGRLLLERYPDKFWGIGPAAPDGAEEGYTPRSVRGNICRSARPASWPSMHNSNGSRGRRRSPAMPSSAATP